MKKKNQEKTYEEIKQILSLTPSNEEILAQFAVMDKIESDTDAGGHFLCSECNEVFFFKWVNQCDVKEYKQNHGRNPLTENDDLFNVCDNCHVLQN